MSPMTNARLTGLLALWLGSCTWAGASTMRVLPEGELPADTRLKPMKDLDGYFPFKPSPNRDGWERRAEELRRQILVSLGLWPFPEKTPLRPVIHGRIDLGEYSVEKVFFESMPGFFVTGNLYRPTKGSGPFPGVLSPHGHWSEGRFYDVGPQEVRELIAQGAERFQDGGRSPLQSRCVQLARMGCVVFHYDMIGYADSRQISESIAHGFSKQRPEMNQPDGWGLFSPAAEAHLQSVMGLQTWNSIRALDFLCSLVEVDAKRIAVTGASGGGTQTFILGAIDERPAVAFPAVMVSTAMQGGCTCENACLLRVETGNVEFAALFAPKPLGMTAADDWTQEMPTKGFPDLQQHYALFDVRDRVSLTPLLHFGHNYNYVSRAAMYRWLNRHLALGIDEPIVEEDYRRLTREQMSVWDANHPAPEGGPAVERRLLQQWHEDTQTSLRRSQASPEEFEATVGVGLRTVLRRSLPPASAVKGTIARQSDGDRHRTLAVRLRNESAAEDLPVLVLIPAPATGRVVIWLDQAGKNGLYGDGDDLRPEVTSLLAAGISVVGVDLLFQGEFLADGQSPTRTRRVANPREAAAYTFGYNDSLFAQRVHDVLTVTAWLLSGSPEIESAARNGVGIIGLGEAGRWAAAVRAVAPRSFRIAAIDTGGFRFVDVPDLHDPSFLPGGARYLDLPGMIALGAPGRLWLAGEGARRRDLPQAVRRAYREARTQLTIAASDRTAAGDAAQWLVDAWD